MLSRVFAEKRFYSTAPVKQQILSTGWNDMLDIPEYENYKCIIRDLDERQREKLLIKFIKKYNDGDHLYFGLIDKLEMKLPRGTTKKYFDYDEYGPWSRIKK